MKKYYLLLAIILISAMGASAQDLTLNADSLYKAWKKNKQDTTQVQWLNSKGATVYFVSDPDSAMICFNQALALSKRIHYANGEVISLGSIANAVGRAGNLPLSLKMMFELLPKAIAAHNQYVEAQCCNGLGQDYGVMKDFRKSLIYTLMFRKLVMNGKIQTLYDVAENNTAKVYISLHMPDSALYYTNLGLAILIRRKNKRTIGYLIRNLGSIQMLKGNYRAALNYFNESLQSVPKIGDHYLTSDDDRHIAEVYQKLNLTDSCISFAKGSYSEALLDKNPSLVMQSTAILTGQYHDLGDYKNAYDYQQIMLKANDSLYSQQKALQIQSLSFTEEQRKRELITAATDYQNKVRFYAMLGVLGVLVLIASVLLYANSQRKKANLSLQQQNEKIESQHRAIEKTLAELKVTQTQLIQSEKMASLGELTAGIAHEIQNPLNFVNNFSEVNKEMVGELEDELKKGNIEEALAIAADIKGNEEKINHHGKRADFIVKGMLLHSRNTTGEKEATDINAMANEFLKLSYHGLRAKDKNFNAELVTNFDKDLPKVVVAHQDIGRVLLNLFNNAFYAVNQKQKAAGADYKPEVTVSTSIEKNNMVIKVKDNGNGIPDAIKDKIMQPFFTTKPTGEGTGLGLSLSYDIVVKGHGGTITVDTKENEFTEFIVSLPLK